MTATDRAKRVKLLVMDIDGTLTDGAMYYTRDGEYMKRFSTRDGMGLTLMAKAGYQLAIITSENSEIAAQRAKKLKIEHVILGSRDKTTSLTELASKLALPLDSIAYIGDDVNDGPVMKICGLSGCPSDAVEAIKSVSHWQSQFPGGNGAVREFAEFILMSNDQPITLQENW